MAIEKQNNIGGLTDEDYDYVENIASAKGITLDEAYAIYEKSNFGELDECPDIDEGEDLTEFEIN
ncbi:MAG: hypothetical protein RSE07_02520 [Oscillospiraceae bacterium]